MWAALGCCIDCMAAAGAHTCICLPVDLLWLADVGHLSKEISLHGGAYQLMLVA